MALSRIFSFSFIDPLGIPLDGGMMFTYLAGTTVPATTYYDETGTLNTNPVILDSRGCASFYVDNAVEYLFILKDRNGNTVWSADHVTANSKTFVAEGSNTIDATEEVVDGKTVVTFRVKPNSIGREELKNPRELIVDAETMEMVSKDIGGRKYVVLKSKGGGGGASEEYVDDKVSAEARTRGYEDELIRQSIPTKTSQLQNDSGFITGVLVGEGLYYNSDGKLTATEPDGNFIDITNEWVFMNGFRLQYNGSTPGEGNDMRILYSPVSDIVKFTSSCRINRTTVLVSDWNNFLQYRGNRFYTTYNAPNIDLAPAIGSTPALGGMSYTVGVNAQGSSINSLLKFAYVGSPTSGEQNCSLAIQPFLDKNGTSIYGCILQNLVLKVHKKV